MGDGLKRARAAARATRAPSTTFQVVTDRDEIVLETDDWVLACEAALTTHWPRGGALYVRGTHPTHDWGPPREGQGTPDRRCSKCGGWDNGSYGSQAPCGYDFTGEALVTALWRELASRRAAEPVKEG